MNLLIAGTRGEGKSTLSLWLARQWSPSVFILDPRRTYDGAGHICWNVNELIECVRQGVHERQPIIVRFEDVPLMVQLTAESLFPELLDPRSKMWTGTVSIIVDECINWQSPHYMDKTLGKLLREAPRDRVMIIQNTHQLQDWNPISKSILDEMYLFRQIGPRNRKLVSEFCGEDVAEMVGQLPPHHCIRYRFGRVEGSQWELWGEDHARQWFSPISVPAPETNVEVEA